jgi:DNA-binding response OmpR family regulator
MQVVINLLSNAIKFSPAEAEVIVAIENYNDNVRITVRDHGPGIPQDFRSRIFEKFAQADGLNARQRGGTGLGLSIVKQIVVQLGGEVGFSDAPGGGTIFYVDLLRWEYGVDAELKGNEELNRVRILLCESDTDVAIAMSKRLCQEGFEIDLSRTAAGAIAKAMTTFYSAILVDLQLRDCDGIALLQQLRAQPKCCDTPIFVVSAVPGRGPDDLRSSSLNVLDWFNKPLDIPRLLGRLRATIARGGSTWLRVIHLDHDSEVRGIVAQALEGHADVVSVATNESARHALVGSGFDLAVIELAMGMGSSCRLLPELIDGVYGAIPVIVYSTPLANSVCVAEVRTALVKTQASMDRLVASLRKSVVPTFQTAEKRGR